MIYLDNAATTFPKPEAVYRAMDNNSRSLGVNAGRGSYKLAREASSLISETKDLLRNLTHVDRDIPVVFSPSITVALNQVAYGLDLPQGSNVYVSPYEHNAVARCLNYLSKQRGFNIRQIPINKDTLEIDVDQMRLDFSTEKPKAVFCTHISNVTGYILPVEDIFSISKEYAAINVLDTAQSLGLVDVRGDLLDVDIIAFAGHKTLYGPFGIGGFINVSRVELKALIIGGTGSDSLNLNMPNDLEGEFEASSSNIVAISGLNAALKNLNTPDLYCHEKELTKYLIEKLKQNQAVKLYLPKNLDRHVGIVSFSVTGYTSDEVGTILDEDFDIAVRTGYHCAPFIHEYLNDRNTLGTVRVGLGQFNTEKCVDSLIDAVNSL